MTNTLQARGRALHERFFARVNRERLEALRDAMKAEEEARALEDVLGVHDETLLAHLVSLGLTHDTVAALSLVPLIAVAWSDKILQNKEREAILLEAVSMGIHPSSDTYHLIEQWLTVEPNEQLVADWSAYVTELKPHLSAEQLSGMRDAILPRAERIARASGGFPGITSGTSAEERLSLEWLAGMLS